jgi:uncharacterized protein
MVLNRTSPLVTTFMISIFDMYEKTVWRPQWFNVSYSYIMDLSKTVKEGQLRKMLQFAAVKYINLETYRRSGQAVRTPVWFVENNGILYVRTSSDTGKYKRIRNNPSVQIAPCNILGSVKGRWIKAEARIASQEDKMEAFKMLEKKYGIAYKMTRIFMSRKNYVVITIKLYKNYE